MVSKNVNVKIDTVKMDDRFPSKRLVEIRREEYASGMKTRRGPYLMQSVEEIKKN
jgi:hypothetical protein